MLSFDLSFGVKLEEKKAAKALASSVADEITILSSGLFFKILHTYAAKMETVWLVKP